MVVAEAGVFDVVAELWRYPGDQGWHFVALPHDVGDEITDLTAGRRRGFGSVKVVVRVGGSEWSTSLFPDTARGTLLLPVKRAVRVAEGLEAGEEVALHLRLADL